MKSAADIHAAFLSANDDSAVIGGRFRVLDSAHRCLSVTADRQHVAGYVLKHDHALASALVVRLGAELCDALHSLLRESKWYAGAAILRQLIEVEYLAFLGYSNPAQLAKWYRASPTELKNQFKPSEMRKASGGMFSYSEYSHHCEMGGHPHPRARSLVLGYEHALPPRAFLLPDSVQHVRRLWTSVRLTAERENGIDSVSHAAAADLNAAIEEWRALENPLIEALDGIHRTP